MFQTRRGYQTADLPISFLKEALLLRENFLLRNRCRVFPILTTSRAKDGGLKGNNYWFLQRKGPKGDSSYSAAAFKQLHVLEGRLDWDLRQARAHITNEAAMVLGELIVNTSNKINPLKHWNNAVWLYQWVTVDPSTAHCVLLAFIPIVQQNIPLAKPHNFRWVKLDDTFTTALTVMPKLGRIVCMNGLTETSLRQVVGDSIFAKDLSPPPPMQKKSKAQGQYLQDNPL